MQKTKLPKDLTVNLYSAINDLMLHTCKIKFAINNTRINKMSIRIVTTIAQ